MCSRLRRANTSESATTCATLDRTTGGWFDGATRRSSGGRWWWSCGNLLLWSCVRCRRRASRARLVRARNTSSRVAWRRLRSTASMPASSSARTTSMRRVPSVSGAVTMSASSSKVASFDRERAPARRPRRRARWTPTTLTSMRSSPMRAFSSSGVPWATVRPWSSTTMSSASRSASSRYCVVRMIVVPSRTRSRKHLPQVAAAARVEAGGGLVEEQHLGVGDDGWPRGRAGGACRRRTSSRAWSRRR